MSRVSRLYLLPSQTGQVTYISGRKYISIRWRPSPRQCSHRPPFALNEKRAGEYPRARASGTRAKQLPDEAEDPRVGCRYGARRPADRRLIDQDHFSQALGVLQAGERGGMGLDIIDPSGQRTVERIQNQGALARTGNSCYARHASVGKIGGNGLEVVSGRSG